MREDDKKSTTSNPEIGAPLKNARIAAAFTIEQVAARMNLDADIIFSIEEGDFNRHLSPAFYRGYLRTYANLMSLPADEIIDNYNAFIQQDSLTSHITPTFENDVVAYFNQKKSTSIKYLVISLIILALVGGSFVIYQTFFKAEFEHKNASLQQPTVSQPLENSTHSHSESSNYKSIPLVIDAETEASEDTQSSLNTKPSAKLPATTSTRAQDTLMQKQSAQLPALATSQTGAQQSLAGSKPAHLQINFSGDCWVKITDATGEVLAHGMKHAGKNMFLAGQTPFKLILGDASAVEIKLDEKAVDLSSYPSGRRIDLMLPLNIRIDHAN